MRNLHTIDRSELEELVGALLDALYGPEAADASLDEAEGTGAAFMHDVFVAHGLAPSTTAPRAFRPPAGVGVSITLDEQARPVATVTFEHMSVTVHESLVTPGALNIEVDAEGAPLIVHVDDAEIFRYEECTPEGDLRGDA
ncbi:MAG TPA: hypothetical protein VHB47_09465 [Thermoanaerobaculia bacterium]|jgi:hypothetical protein|nr:hypothetical protein [Thermoanaerobaculia bacterium]